MHITHGLAKIQPKHTTKRMHLIHALQDLLKTVRLKRTDIENAKNELQRRIDIVIDMRMHLEYLKPEGRERHI